MNLILLLPEDFTESEGDAEGGEALRGTVRLAGRRRRHVLEIVRASRGDELTVGLLGGAVGRGLVTNADDERLELEVVLADEPPPKLDATLVLAVPRPPVMTRVLSAVTAIGVARIVLLHTKRVEKTYWNARVMQPDSLREALLLGLEQARDTRLPELALERRFRPFAEDELPGLAERAESALLATPEAPRPCPSSVAGPALLAIGPEGGFVAFEVECLAAAGLEPVHLGARALRVETAVPVLLSRLLPG